MKTIIIICASVLFLSFVPGKQATVYVCNNGTTEVYHVNKDCSSLKRCSHEHLSMTLSEAKEKELRLCGFED